MHIAPLVPILTACFVPLGGMCLTFVQTRPDISHLRAAARAGAVCRK